MSNNSIFVENKSVQSLGVLIDELFKFDERIFIDGNISYTALLDYAKEYDNNVITTLYNNKETREKFFKTISDINIFQHEKLDAFVNSSLIKNSYTKYKNQIGLFVKNNSDIVLNFPFKDCYLQGGQTEDESKREEIFFNETIAFNEIDMLLSDKAFCNFSKYTKNGKEDFTEFSRNENGTIKDNLLIKGNNFLALHSLKHEFRGKVKLIYIDPPYNTGSDSFKYNDNFNHSAWLVFMKNRLEIAKEMLSDDGAIFVQCDDNEQAYLKVLMDEIFGRGNFINSISVNMSNMSGPKIQHAYMGKRFPKVKEYILLYVKSKNKYKLNIPRTVKEEWDNEYSSIIPTLTRDEYIKLRDHIVNNETDLANLIITKHKLMSLSEYAKSENIEINTEWKINNMWRIVATKPNESVLKLAKRQNAHLIDSELICLESSKGNTSLIKTNFNTETATTRIAILFAEDKSSMFFGDVWNDIPTTGGIAQEGDVSFPKGKKPEKLLKRIIETVTSKNDIVLDFFNGSGTTAAVCHKMNRQYIGIEQMDATISITIQRLNNIIKGDFTGISKEVDWQGGGEFVCFELAKFNEKCKDLIMKVKDSKEFITLFDIIENKFFISYEEDVLKFRNKINNESSDFYKKTLKEQKIEFVEKLDLNQMYVPKSECEDELYELGSKDIELTKKFYGEV